MIQGNKAAGYGQTRDTKGHLIEHEFRQCSHCQAMWVYKPGSGKKYGFCFYCNGLLCTRCNKIAWMRGENRCVPYFDGVMEMSRKYAYDDKLGIFVRK